MTSYGLDKVRSVRFLYVPVKGSSLNPKPETLQPGFYQAFRVQRFQRFGACCFGLERFMALGFQGLGLIGSELKGLGFG